MGRLLGSVDLMGESVVGSDAPEVAKGKEGGGLFCFCARWVGLWSRGSCEKRDPVC